MSDPFNILPTDPAWAAKCDAITKAAAADLGCMVVMVALQPEGKCGVCVEGVPADDIALSQMASDPAKLLMLLATIAHRHAQITKENPQ